MKKIFSKFIIGLLITGFFLLPVSINQPSKINTAYALTYTDMFSASLSVSSIGENSAKIIITITV